MVRMENIVERNIDNMSKDEKQAFIDNVEAALDYNMRVSKEDYEIYQKLIDEHSSKDRENKRSENNDNKKKYVFRGKSR